MKNKSRRARASRLAPVFKTLLIGVVTYILLVVVLMLGITPEQHDIRVGLPAAMDILATKDVNDMVTTEKKRDEAAAQVELSYKSADPSVASQVLNDLDVKFAALTELRAEVAAGEADDITEEAFESLSLPVKLTREQYIALIDADNDTYKMLTDDTVKLVRDLLRNTLLEGQEASAISTMSRNLSSMDYAAPLVGMATEVMRACVRPNMLIDEAATEANRQKARDAVETVTCVKGEVIVRRGDIVTEAQYQMLSSLGLLKEDSVDIPLFAGIALIAFLIMGSLGLYLFRLRRDLLKPKPLTLLCLIDLLVVGLSLGFSRWNTYLMPLSLGVMLVSMLIDHRVALFFNLALGLTVSLLADTSGGLFTVAMFSVVLMSMVSGPVVLAVFSRRMQRTTALAAGVLVGVSNFAVTMAVGLINSAELRSVLTNAGWAMVSGVLSGVLCIGIQPLLESLFNLATNARLIELSNPNQPLLRRLLLEAPGTYHHAIIVANLAEAGALAIGGNGLLARVGAYYHDIGKLKRPVYFSENQMGDNPHDRTDPRVSAAILTAHPRDGAAMAQKARIPEPVVDIIRQHHGDGVALWFYDKAVKLYGADQVDISAFRYDGPRPRTREAAAVMLADTIEAAVRSIPNPDPEKVDAKIRSLVRGKLDDGQLDESELTFSDLEKICSAFSTVLTGVFHERIEYPDVKLPPREPVEAQTEDAAAETQPAKPAAENESTAEAQPAKPAAENKPAAEAQPAKPAAEAQPAKPAAKAQPAKPAAENKPAAEAQPAKPATEAQPAKPAAEAQPAKPAAEDAAKAPEEEREAASDGH